MKKNLNNPSQTLKYAGTVPGLPFVSATNQYSNKEYAPEKIEFNKKSYEKNKKYGNFLVVTDFGSLIIDFIDAITPCATVNPNTREN